MDELASASTWPGFVDDPCEDCGCPGKTHQPVCVETVVRAGRAEYCGCPSYRLSDAQQIAAFDVNIWTGHTSYGPVAAGERNGT